MIKTKSFIAIILSAALSITSVCPVLAIEESGAESATATGEVVVLEDSSDSANIAVTLDEGDESSDHSVSEESGDSSTLTDDGGSVDEAEDSQKAETETEHASGDSSVDIAEGTTEETVLQHSGCDAMAVEDADEDLQEGKNGKPQGDENGYEEILEEIFSGQEVRFAVDASEEIISIPIRVRYGQTIARSMLRYINEFRTGQNAWVWNSDNTQKVPVSGLDELQYDLGLERIAMQRAAELALSYSHTRPDGSDVFELMSYQDYGTAGENIAAGYESAETVFDGWREEDESYVGQGHRRNMLNSQFGYVGIGHVYFGGVHYWTQVFSDSSFEGSGDEPYEAWTEDGEPVDPSSPNDHEETVYINIASDRVDIKLETETEVSVPVNAWMDLPTVNVLVKVQYAWPDRYYQLPIDDYYLDNFSWDEGEAGKYTIKQDWSETEDNTVVFQICAEERGQYTTAASFLGNSITVSVNAVNSIESGGEWELEVLDPVMSYDGTEKRARVKVLYEGTELTEDEDYIVSYENNVETGTALIRVQGKENYVGTLLETFLIREIDEVAESGRVGEYVIPEEGNSMLPYYIWWAIDQTGTLYVYNEGDMLTDADFDGDWGYSEEEALVLYPWHEFSDQIYKVVVSEGITCTRRSVFVNLTECTEAVLPGSLKRLSGDTFNGCTKLETVVLPQSLEEIVGGDFANCISLANIQLPDSIQVIGPNTFKDCTGFVSITIPDSVTYIGEGAFADCTRLEKIDISNSTEFIGMYAFSGCSALDGVILPDSVTYIGPRAFYDCTSLTSIAVPDAITEIYDNTFYGCTSLKKVKLPAQLETIEIGAFCDCSSLESIALPPTLKTIGALPTQYMAWENIGLLLGVFEGCTGLTSIMLPNSVTYMNEGTFRRCNNLISIALSDKLTYLGPEAFTGCANLQSIYLPDTLTKIERETFWGCNSMKSLRLPINLETIGFQAFYFCPSLQTVMVPPSVTSIGEMAFGEDLELTLHGEAGSYVQTYARENDIPFIAGIPISDTKITGIVSKTYTGKAITQSLTVKYGGVTLTSGTDYTLSYLDNIYAGTASVIIKGKGKYGGKVTKVFTIKPAPNTITARNYTRTYSAKTQSFDLGVKIKRGTPTYKSGSSSVTVSKAGKVTIKARFIGKVTITIKSPVMDNYAAAASKITITVLPTKTALVSVSNSASKKITVKWRKNTVGSGYQIQYSTSSKFTSAKTVAVTKNSTVSKTIGSLVKGKKYYVRIRTYKAVGSTKYYSGWSAAKYLTINK